jgi:DNA primase
MEPKEEIKQRLPIELVVGEYVELKRAGRNYKALSPFSAEKTPSFIVSPEKNIWHDFSSGKGGDIFTFIMEVEGLSFPESLQKLAERAGVELPDFKKPDTKLKQQKQILYQINTLATKYFQASLLKNPEALQYLKNRGITKQGIKSFKLGYAPNSADGLSKLLQKKGFRPADIQKAGVATNRAGHLKDVFRSRIIFPFIDTDGNILGFTGRNLQEGKDAFGPKYLNTPQTPIYNKSNFLYGLSLAKEPIRKQNQVVLLEGNFDVITSHQAGLEEVVAASGTAITSLQINQIKRLTQNLIFCLDTDTAGISATIRSLELTAKTDLQTYVATIPPEFKDPDELIQKKGIAAWQLAVQSRQDAYLWLIETLAKNLNLNSPAEKGTYAAELYRILSLVQNPVAKQSYLQYLADKLRVSLEVLQQLAATSPPKRYKPIQKTQQLQKEKINKEDSQLLSLTSKLELTLSRLFSLLQTPQTKKQAKYLKELQKLLEPSQIASQDISNHYRYLLSQDSSLLEPTYLAQLSLIREQLLEFSPEDQPQKDLQAEQFKLSLELARKLQHLKLKQELKTATPEQQQTILQQLQNLTPK